MLLATTEQQIHQQGLGLAAGRGTDFSRFRHPRDVLAADRLAVAEKRAVLASWASDASAVQDQPTLRWLLGTPEPVPLAEVRDALARLDH